MTSHAVRRLAALAAVLGMLGAACGGGPADGMEYKDPDERALFVLPDDWNLYLPDELGDTPVPFTTRYGTGLSIIQQVAFDGAAGRNISNLGVSVAGSAYPIGTYTVRTVGDNERDFLSRGILQDVVISGQRFQAGENLFAEDFDFGRDYEGIRRWVPFTDSQTSEEGVVYFVTVTNPDDTAIFSIAAGCSLACWEANSEDIVKVVDSWIVNTRQ